MKPDTATLARFRLQWALDPVLFARDVLDFSPDDKQAALLRSLATQIVVNCTRQWGKSTIIALLAVHMAIFRVKSLIPIFAPTDFQSMELFSKVRDFLKRVPGGFKEASKQNEHEIVLANGSRIVARPENPDGVRGLSAPDLVIIDEAAFIDERLFTAVMPMRITKPKSRLVLLSSPNGKRGQFWEAWDKGADDWERHQVKATECPRIAPEEIEKQRRTKGDAYIQQEFMCEFVDSLTSVFTHEQVMAAMATYDEPMITIK